ncbi:MAG: EamA family transporter [Tannerella sp.]|jgi:undecaprenyl phosphate-alpha-L-ara4N flippase subunit ArnE|nr:EamA family transporter [Tannerella sp.]
MLKLICASIIQCTFLAAGQVFLKIGLEKFEKFSWTWTFVRDFLTNWWILASGLSMVAASIIWFYILKHNDLSLVYPLISISYIFGTLAAVFIFHETVPPTRWIGVLLIMIGVAFLTKSA